MLLLIACAHSEEHTEVFPKPFPFTSLCTSACRHGELLNINMQCF